MVWNDMQWYSYSLPFLLMQTFWMDTHWMDPYWWDTCWRYVLVGYVLVGYVCDSCWCTPFEWIRIEWIRIAWIRIGGIRVERIRIGGIRIAKPADANVLKGSHCMDTYWWDTYWWDTFWMDMCGICVVWWICVGYVWCEICVGYVWCEICVGYVWREICVGYVWCEIRQQSSEEPCDETSFGNKYIYTYILCLFFLFRNFRRFCWQALARMARAMAANAGAVLGPDGEEDTFGTSPTSVWWTKSHFVNGTRPCPVCQYQLLRIWTSLNRKIDFNCLTAASMCRLCSSQDARKFR